MADKREKLRQHSQALSPAISDVMARLASGTLATADSPVKNMRFAMTGVVIDRDLDEREWLTLLGDVRKIKQAYLWVLGDILVYGIKRAYRETHRQYQQAAKITGYTAEALQNLAWICHSVEISRRRENLSFSHHAEVASLNPDEQMDWLQKAQTNKWSAKTLRREIKDENEPEALPAPPLLDKINKRRMDKVWRNLSRGTTEKIKRDDLRLIRAWLDEVERELRR